MKKALAFVLSAFLTLSTVSCGAETTTSTPPSGAPESSAATTGTTGETTKISYWYSWTDKIQENNINLTEQFNQTVGKEKGIEVTAEYQGTYDELHQKLQAAHIAGTAPAVSVMEIAATKTFAENKVIEPLSPYIDKDKVDMEDFHPGLLVNAEVNDTWYGLPYLRSTPILYLNTTLLEKAGLDPKGPQTWAELAEYCKVIKEKTGAFGMTLVSDVWYLEALFYTNGSSTLTADETKTNINTPEAKEIFTFFNDLKEKGYIRCIASGDSDMAQADIMNQSSAMWFNSTGSLANLLSIAKENSFALNTTFIPKNKEYGVPTGGCNLVMSASASDAEKEAAWTFIKWMAETDQAAYSTEHTGYLPTRKSAAKTKTITDLFATTPQFKVALEQLELYGHGRPMNPGYAEGMTELKAVMDAIWANDADVDKTLADAETKINAVLG